MATENLPAQSQNSPRAADSVIAEIENRIFRGELSDGAALPSERALIEEFGVSRTVVREAVKNLASKGLVEAKPRFRPVVRRPNYDTAFTALEGLVNHLLRQSNGVRTLYETRILVEAALVREAALHCSREDLVRLRTALEANANAVEDSKLFYQTDMAFHAVLYEISGNPLLPALHRAYVTWLTDHWMQMPRLPERNRRNVEAHRAIVNGILARDPDAAEAALRGHLEDAWQQVRATFELND